MTIRVTAWRGAALAAAALAASAAGAGTIASSWRAESVTDLPIIERLPATRVPGACVIFMSGDGGWADIDRTIAGRLVDAGLPVVGLDSLRWFLLGRSAARSARDLLRIMMLYHDVLHADRFACVGYSRGADALPFMINRLPADAKAWIRLLALLAPERRTDFQMFPLHMLKGGPPSWVTHALKPELDRIALPRIIGFYGQDEAAESLCTEAPADFATVTKLPGGHHFGGNARQHDTYVAIADALRAEITAAVAP